MEPTVLIRLVNQHLSVSLWQSTLLPAAHAAPAAWVAGFAPAPCGKSLGRQAAGARLAKDDPHTSSGNGYLRRLTSQSLAREVPMYQPSRAREQRSQPTQKALSSTQDGYFWKGL